jgi:hypothetical protein
MERLWQLVYPERRFFDGKPALKRRVEHLCRVKKDNAKSRAWRRILFIGLPSFVLILSVGSYIQVISGFPAGYEFWIMMIAMIALGWFFVFLDREPYRRDLRYALTQCGFPLCIECGYDLAKIDPSSSCPECGATYPELGTGARAGEP